MDLPNRAAFGTERRSMENHFHFMLKLGVNIDHVATMREARYRGRGFGEP